MYVESIGYYREDAKNLHYLYSPRFAVDLHRSGGRLRSAWVVFSCSFSGLGLSDRMFIHRVLMERCEFSVSVLQLWSSFLEGRVWRTLGGIEVNALNACPIEIVYVTDAASLRGSFGGVENWMRTTYRNFATRFLREFDLVLNVLTDFATRWTF